MCWLLTEAVRNFAHLTFKTIGVGFESKYQGNVEYAVIGDTRLNLLEKDVALNEEQTLSKINPRVYRSAEVELHIGNFANAKDQSGWRIKAMFEQLWQRRVQADFGHNTKELSF